MDRLENVQRFEQYLRRRFPGRRTPVDYVSDVRQFMAICSKPWREVMMHDIDHFVDQQREAKLKPATIKRRVAALKTFFDFLAEDSNDLGWPNPVRFKRHAGKQPRRLPRDLSDTAVEQVWNVIESSRDRAWFVLMWRAGLRVGEVVNLKTDDILLSPRDGRPARLRVYGKGQKERIVLLTTDAFAVLTTWLQERPTSDCPHIFLNARGRPLTVNGIEWLLRGYGKQANIPLTPHQLRHTYARQLTEAGMPLPSLSKLMGHADVSTTQLYTAGADPELSQAYHNAMARLAHSQPKLEDPVSILASSEVQTLPPAPSVPSTEKIPPLPDWSAWMPDLPAEMRQASLEYARGHLSTCKPKRQRAKALQILGQFRRFWTWLQSRRSITHLADLSLDDLWVYQEERSAAGVAPATINRDLQYILALLHEQAEQGKLVDNSVFRLRLLKRADSLPRHLSELESQRLEAFVLNRLDNDDALTRLENACFFVLAHTGLRASECVDLCYQDIDLHAQRLFVYQGKGQRDRVVYLSDIACQAIRRYLDDSSRRPTDPLWVRPTGRPITDSWLRECITALGDAAGVTQVTPHRLRHTLATRLLNTGMDITRIQKILGHQHIGTTMIYARVLDATVEAEYHQTMSTVEGWSPPLSNTPIPITDWPAQIVFTQDDQIFKEPPLDNSV
jgi:site-specific recombinase XerD